MAKPAREALQMPPVDPEFAKDVAREERMLTARDKEMARKAQEGLRPGDEPSPKLRKQMAADKKERQDMKNADKAYNDAMKNYKSGGKVRGGGIAERGIGRGRMC